MKLMGHYNKNSLNNYSGDDVSMLSSEKQIDDMLEGLHLLNVFTF